MSEKQQNPKPVSAMKSKIQKIQEIYGKDRGSASLEEASEYLKSKDYKSLADFLVPAK